ncbi:MAG TPA: class I SAM-dependent methyltransferase [Myxococcales bacterium]|nr:class I SAM-dependent methyltransferase [Myxococcales bacterium]
MRLQGIRGRGGERAFWSFEGSRLELRRGDPFSRPKSSAQIGRGAGLLGRSGGDEGQDAARWGDGFSGPSSHPRLRAARALSCPASLGRVCRVVVDPGSRPGWGSGVMARDPVDLQREFYASRPHGHLQPRFADAYSARLVARLAAEIGLDAQARVLEVGAGFGRFTFELLGHCKSVVALDLSEEALARLAEARDERGISADRCRPVCADLQQLEPGFLDGPFDFIVGFFILHHLPDYREAITRLAPCLGRPGRMAFVEPNRRNPLFLAQVAFCEDMTWAEEKGMFALGHRGVERACLAAGLKPRPTRRFGFFPPQIINRFAFAGRLEEGIERLRLLDPVLPFLVLGADSSANVGGSEG